MPNSLEIFFKLSLLLTLFLSFYIFISVTIYKNPNHKPIFSTWQFPMLLAIFLDVCLLEN
uniref:Uncharacterized protein n=1 Tax=viral metagenome TaxID=1070528 RepID=A0A6C0CXB2_9ZZZZ